MKINALFSGSLGVGGYPLRPSLSIPAWHAVAVNQEPRTECPKVRGGQVLSSSLAWRILLLTCFPSTANGEPR